MKVLWCYITSVDKLQGDSWVVSVEIYFWLPPAAAYPNRGSGRQASRGRGPGGARRAESDNINNTPWHARGEDEGGYEWAQARQTLWSHRAAFQTFYELSLTREKETGTREPRQPAATTSWKHFSRLTSEVSDLRRRAAWPTLFGCM